MGWRLLRLRGDFDIFQHTFGKTQKLLQIRHNILLLLLLHYGLAIFPNRTQIYQFLKPSNSLAHYFVMFLLVLNIYLLMKGLYRLIVKLVFFFSRVANNNPETKLYSKHLKNLSNFSSKIHSSETKFAYQKNTKAVFTKKLTQTPRSYVNISNLLHAVCNFPNHLFHFGSPVPSQHNILKVSTSLFLLLEKGLSTGLCCLCLDKSYTWFLY